MHTSIKLEKVFSVKNYINSGIMCGLLNGIIFDKKIKLKGLEYILLSEDKKFFFETGYRKIKCLNIYNSKSLLELGEVSKYFLKREKDETLFDNFEALSINLDENCKKILNKFSFNNLKFLSLSGSNFDPLIYFGRMGNLKSVRLQNTNSEFATYLGKAFRKNYGWKVSFKNKDTGIYY